MNSFTPIRVLAIDDLQSIHDDYRKILQQGVRPAVPDLDAEEAAIFGTPAQVTPACTFTLDSAYDGPEGLRFVQRALAEGQPYAVAFVDMRMPPGWDGVETVRRLWGVDPDLQVVICTAYSDYSWTDTVGALANPDNLIILKKPFDHVEVQQLAFALARKWELAREVRGRLANLDELVRQRTGELQAAEDRFSQMFSASPLAQCLISLDDLRILEVNAGFETCFHLSRAACHGQNLHTACPGLVLSEWEPLLAKLRQGEPVEDAPAAWHTSNGAAHQLRCYARPVTISGRRCAIWIVRDVTPHLLLETQLRHAQKMEAVGQLAAGVAHDFNNLLTVVECCTSELLADEHRDVQRSHLESVRAAALRAASLTRQLLVFSRKQISQLETLDICAVLGELRPLLRRLITEEIDLEWDVPETLPAILADRGSFDQVIINLIVNARDALGHRGYIRVSATLRQFASAEESRHAQGRAGRFIALSVADNGPGITAHILPRIFEPFFTTKAPGQGTGLGLSTAFSLVQQQGGWIDVRTTPGAGATFTIYQPVVGAPAQPAPESTFAAPCALATPALRVLAVEDDSAIREIISTIFRRRGIRATIACTGPEALGAWESEGPFDLLLSDMIMPGGLTGLDIARDLRQRDPDLPVVLMTGYSTELATITDRPLPGIAPQVLLKPFAMEALVEAMNTATLRLVSAVN